MDKSLTDATGSNIWGTSHETVSWKRTITCKGQLVEHDAEEVIKW